MKLLLLNDAGSPVACFEDFQQYAGRSPAQTFALLDLVEKLIESVDGNLGDASWSEALSDEKPGSAGAP
jgi:hypothetical protein